MTLNNIKDFVQGYYNYFRNYLDDESLPKHVREQALYRAMLCVGCLNNGKCTECKCATPAMFFSPGKEDSLGRWGKMIDVEEWEKFKSENNIELINNFEEIMFDEIRKKYNFAVLRPEWFVYRGQNVFSVISPAFLMILDEAFDRVDYVPYFMNHNGSRTITVMLSNNYSQRWKLIKELMSLGLSLTIVGEEYMEITMADESYFKVNM